MATSKSPAELELDRLGFKYTLVPEFNLDQLSDDRWVQVRESEHYAPKEQVQRYVVQMSESTFPPIVVTKDNWGIDGKTRIQARKVRNEKFCTAFMLDESYEGATDKRRNEMAALGATLNCNAGMALTSREIRAQVRNFITLNWKSEQIGRALGAKASVVTAVRKEIAAENRISNLDVPADKLSGATLRALGGKDIVAINDAPYAGLANLAADAGLNAKEISATAKELREAGSDSAALEILAQERAEMEPRIRDHRDTGVGKPPASRMLRQRLGWINQYAVKERELVETSAAGQAVAIEYLQKAITVLTKALELQKERADAHKSEGAAAA